MNIWKKAVRTIKGNALEKSVMNIYPYMDKNGQIWIHLFPTKDVDASELQSLLANKDIQSEPFTGMHNVSNVGGLSVGKNHTTFNKFMTEATIPNTTRPLGSETCVRIGLREYAKHQDVIKSLKNTDGLDDGIKRLKMLQLETNIQEVINATSNKNGAVIYFVPHKGKKLSDIQKLFAMNNLPAFEYKTSLQPNPVLAVKMSDLNTLPREKITFLMDVIDNINKHKNNSVEMSGMVYNNER